MADQQDRLVSGIPEEGFAEHPGIFSRKQLLKDGNFADRYQLLRGDPGRVERAP
jgi:hypothetical protein